jgi:hypothetical protein
MHTYKIIKFYWGNGIWNQKNIKHINTDLTSVVTDFRESQALEHCMNRAFVLTMLAKLVVCVSPANILNDEK